MLTIKQLADYVGVTVRAVRHYEARGLLPEPERDASGYRRYGAQAVIDLVRIKTLAEAGVPLSRVQALLKADPHEFARGVEEVDRQLQAEIDRLQAARDRVARLNSGDELVLPPEVIAHLEQLRALGISEHSLAVERDSWIIGAAHGRERVAEWAARKRRLLDDPDFQRLYVAMDRALFLSADDPRLVELADDFCAFLERAEEEWAAEAAEAEAVAEPMSSLIDSQIVPATPATRRLSALLAERGWTGWTNIKRSPAPSG